MSNNGEHNVREMAQVIAAHLSDLTERITNYLQYVLGSRMGFVIVMWPQGKPESIITASNAWDETHAKKAVSAASDEYDEDAQNIITPSDIDHGGGSDGS